LLSPQKKLCRALAYQFRDSRLIVQALTHRSIGSKNNERLEFLGDAVLGCIIADELFHRFPAATEGELTRLRASLVKGATLAVIGRELNLGDCLRLGSGELKSGGFRRDSILACGVEAILGAVYIDGGFEATKALILRLYQQRLEAVSPETAKKDSKTRLQELLQSRQQALPIYEQTSVEGESHDQIFHVVCRAKGLDELAKGKGTSRRKAEQDAARKAYQILAK